MFQNSLLINELIMFIGQRAEIDPALSFFIINNL